MSAEPQRRTLIVATVALAVLAAVVGFQFLDGDESGSTSPTTEPGPTAAISSPPSDIPTRAPGDGGSTGLEPEGPGDITGDPMASPPGPIPPAAPAAASKAVLTYTEYSWRDPSYDSRRDRLARLSTDTFITIYDQMQPPADQARDEWQFAVVEERYETDTTVEKVALETESGLFDNTGQFLTFVVEYTTSVRSASTDGWTDPTASLVLWVTVADLGGRWLVNDIAEAN